MAATVTWVFSSPPSATLRHEQERLQNFGGARLLVFQRRDAKTRAVIDDRGSGANRWDSKSRQEKSLHILTLFALAAGLVLPTVG